MPTIEARFNIESTPPVGVGSIMPISIGQPYHEGEQLAATVESINHTFSEGCCVVAVADALQRFTLQIKENLSAEEALKKAVRNGEEWLARNQETLQKLKLYRIIRWEEWTTTSSFQEKHQAVRALYDDQKNQNLRSAIDKVIGKFLAMLARDPHVRGYNIESATALCRSYIIEETAVIWCWLNEWAGLSKAHELNASSKYIVYPVATSPAHEGILACLSILSGENPARFVDIQFRQIKHKKVNHDKEFRRALYLTAHSREQSSSSSSPNSLSQGSPPSSLASSLSMFGHSSPPRAPRFQIAATAADIISPDIAVAEKDPFFGNTHFYSEDLMRYIYPGNCT